MISVSTFVNFISQISDTEMNAIEVRGIWMTHKISQPIPNTIRKLKQIFV